MLKFSVSGSGDGAVSVSAVMSTIAKLFSLRSRLSSTNHYIWSYFTLSFASSTQVKVRVGS